MVEGWTLTYTHLHIHGQSHTINAFIYFYTVNHTIRNYYVLKDQAKNSTIHLSTKREIYTASEKESEEGNTHKQDVY